MAGKVQVYVSLDGEAQVYVSLDGKVQVYVSLDGEFIGIIWLLEERVEAQV